MNKRLFNFALAPVFVAGVSACNLLPSIEEREANRIREQARQIIQYEEQKAKKTAALQSEVKEILLDQIEGTNRYKFPKESESLHFKSPILGQNIIVHTIDDTGLCMRHSAVVAWRYFANRSTGYVPCIPSVLAQISPQRLADLKAKGVEFYIPTSDAKVPEQPAPAVPAGPK